MDGCLSEHPITPEHPVTKQLTEFIKLKTCQETIQIGCTDQKVSGRAGLLTFAGFLHWHRFGEVLSKVLLHDKTRGILAGAQKLAQVAYLRSDVMLPALLAIQRIGSQSSLTRFFQGFNTAGKNLSTFRRLWRWGLERLPSRAGGYALDLDSTRLLHEDGHQEGVKTGYTRLGTKPCWHPLIAVLAEAKLVVEFWLRPGNASCANNVVAFTLDLLATCPRGSGGGWCGPIRAFVSPRGWTCWNSRSSPTSWWRGSCRPVNGC